MTHEPSPAANLQERGVVLLTAAVCLTAIIAVLGLVVDLTHMYVVKAELQAFTDLAAIAGGYELDGTLQGFQNARTVVQTGFAGGVPVSRWNFSSQAVSSASVAFALRYNSAFSINPGAATDYRCIRVSASQTIPYYFGRMLPGMSSSGTVTASSIAGQAEDTKLGDGLSPFSPDAHNALDPDFGFTRGQKYTLKWAPPGQRKTKFCTGDAGFNPAGTTGDRGYLDVGQGTGNSAARAAVVNNDFFLPLPITIGSLVSNVQGDKSVEGAVTTRFQQDSDQTAGTFTTYTGNGRRVIIVPVNDHTDPGRVAGFGAFFLPKNPCGTGSNDACCGEYIGAALEFGSKRAAASSGGLFVVKLFR